MERSRSYREFWPRYLDAHADAGTRWLHFAGTGLGLGALVLGLALGSVVLVVLAPVLAYGLAWLGHFGVARNRPATFTHPLWSLLSDLRMLGLWLTGRLDAELRRHGIQDRRPGS